MLHTNGPLNPLKLYWNQLFKFKLSIYKYVSITSQFFLCIANRINEKFSFFNHNE